MTGRPSTPERVRNRQMATLFSQLMFRNKKKANIQMLAAGQRSTLPTIPSFDMARVDVPELSRHVF